MVCDLTGYRGGIYFEAGFAYGLGLDVIYTCREDWCKEEILKDKNGEEVTILYDKNKKEITINKVFILILLIEIVLSGHQINLMISEKNCKNE